MTNMKSVRPVRSGRAGLRFAMAMVWIPLIVSTAAASTGEVRPIAVSTPSGSDAATSLPASQSYFGAGATFYVEIWAQTTHPNGLSSISLDLTYNANLATAEAITHSSLFSELTSGAIDNEAGVLNDLSGSHLGPCTDAVGAAPNWARLAVVQLTAIASEGLVLESRPTGSPVYGTAICGIGDIDPAQIEFGQSAVGLGDVPALSEWGMIVLGLLILVAGSILLRANPVPAQRYGRS